MRIISGKYKSKKIETLKSNDTRPTTDKVRENIFNILGTIDGSVLDLFAGSGALGIEALSRGATEAVFIDGAKDAVKMLYANTEEMDEDIQIFRNDYLRALKALKKRERQFDYIFVDPPYNKGLIDKVLVAILSCDVLKNDGTVIVESSKDEDYNVGPLVSVKDVDYGTVRVNILRVGE
ncbi:16S rRNA (guanine(966)-N(2))-methyltransferase RsmD [Aliicoccus persicus]|uniref:16S rRNA (Guanine(966)-N(2))-methyltransferase RsmD n=1 Tax=Aliicoccus persicus TaxID=930138 RepID=A0A662Z3K8_9STAP|nr:16S rRNA (guanine(966)-N(2))-methyltransferase RsmD [Aliicoccus persicus]SEV80480.1 16S rRNA (guanine(966)-N(2))-methyltransferase RsmD [Aliicoccus persicus]HJE19167.1 16S rRNA (guanine(966)-N(2))-methyltransferase RsmD [Aliicoccus persicus]